MAKEDNRQIESPASPSSQRVEGLRQRVQSSKAQLEMTDKSFILDLFNGQYESGLQCQACGFVSSTLDVFLTLNAPLSIAGGVFEEQVTLESCLSSLTRRVSVCFYIFYKNIYIKLLLTSLNYRRY